MFGSPCAVHVPISLRGVGAKLKDASVVGYIFGYDLTLHDRYKVWIPASDHVFSRTSVYMNENGAYITPASPAPVFPVRTAAPVPRFSLPSAVTEYDGASDSEGAIEDAPLGRRSGRTRRSVSTSTNPPPTVSA